VKSEKNHRLRNNNSLCSQITENNLRSQEVSALKMATLFFAENN